MQDCIARRCQTLDAAYLNLCQVLYAQDLDLHTVFGSSEWHFYVMQSLQFAGVCMRYLLLKALDEMNVFELQVRPRSRMLQLGICRVCAEHPGISKTVRVLDSELHVLLPDQSSL